MDTDEALLRVQTAYPRIYMACHSRHQNARTTAYKLSPRDGALLAHLSESEPATQAYLAHHMGVAKSTLSEALSGLEHHGFAVRAPRGVLRTPAGTKVMSAGSVLETERLRRLLLALSSEERTRAVEGLELLAYAKRK